ncbi:MAG: RNA chaperone Hfq [Acidobacteriota bacterium]|jgi:host factor-I protein
MPDRKLIRPHLRDHVDRRKEGGDKKVPREPQPEATMNPTPTSRRKHVPPEQTNAENFYYLKQMSAKTPVIVVLMDGEELHGWIEWYDKDCVKVRSFNEQSMLVYKHAIKYIHKER